MEKNIRIKIVFSLLFLVLHGITTAQEITVQKKISLNLQNATLPEVLDEISRISGASFSYNPDKIDASLKLSIRKDNQSLHEILLSVLSPMNLEYLIIEDKIVIKKSKGKPDSPKTEPEIKNCILSGYLKDVLNGEMLIGASISIPGSPTGTTSNEYGFYSLRLPEGHYEIVYSFIGYKSSTKQIALLTDSRISVELTAEAKEIEEVKITYAQEARTIESTQTSQSNIRAGTINEMPAFFGETDVIKSLQTLPGIKFYGDGSTLFYVRGGNRDQNLILVDEAVLYNPSHLLGLFSSFSPGAINSIKIYKGDMPAEYGGRLSSLIDIKTREGNLKKFRFSGSTGLFATSLVAEGPFAKDKSSYFVSARRSQLKWIFRKSSPSIQDLYFSDLNIKLNFRLNEHNRIFFSTYGGKDKYLNGGGGNSSGIQWENVASTLRWNHLFNERLFSNLSFTGSRYDYDFITSAQRSEMWNSHISNFTLKSDFTWYANTENTIKFGLVLGQHYFNPGNFESGVNQNTGVAKVPPRNTKEQALYFSNEQDVNERISLRYGLRLSGWSNVGEAYEVTYNDNHIPVDTSFYQQGKNYNQYFIPEPRLSVRIMLTPESSIKAAYSRTSQFVNLLSNSVSPFTSIEIWLPASLNIKPQLANQIVLGYHLNFGKNNYSFSAEGFFRKMKNQIEYADHAKMLFNPFIEGELRYGTSRSSGIELMLSKTSGRLSGWIAYTLSSTKMKFAEINSGLEFPASHDRPHDLSIVANYDLKPRWQVSAGWILMSGGTFTSPTGFYTYNNYQLPIYTSRNNTRLPVYHRLDLATELQLNKEGSGSEHKLKFSLFNAYGRKNPIAVNFNKTLDESNTILIPSNHGVMPELVNTMTWLFSVVPSVSYSFSF